MQDYTEILSRIEYAKENLAINDQEQKQARTRLSCMNIPYDQFMINGSFTDGNKMFESVAQLALGSYDDGCNAIISKLTIGNADKIKDQIEKLFDKINKITEPFDVSIDYEYYGLKLIQAEYQFELVLNQKRYKEIEQAEKEIIKEQLKEERRLEKEMEKLERERVQLQYQFNKKVELDNEYDKELKAKIDGLTEAINHDDFMLRNKRCGYVYVVSNDDMKEGQYKIGITRRNVEERMKELGSGASHSFPMNVHGYVYCDDCFEVERKMHEHFSDQRVNQVNNKKEWFKTTLTEIRQAFKDVCDIDIELKDACDENYLYSQTKVSI